MNTTTKIAAAITTLAIAFGSAVATAAEAQTHTLKQGDRISIKKENGSRSIAPQAMLTKPANYSSPRHTVLATKTLKSTSPTEPHTSENQFS